MELIADNGGCSRSKFVIDICKMMSIQNNFTLTYHQQSNGLVERYSRTILAVPRPYVADHQCHWDLYTDALVCTYKCQRHTSLDVAPFEFAL